MVQWTDRSVRRSRPEEMRQAIAASSGER